MNDVKQDFPILSRKINGKPLVYLDNAATSQKPKAVIEAMVDYYENHNANVHRGIHTLGDESTRMYQQAREKVAKFIGASDPNELVFVRNTTEGINLVAYAWGMANVGKGEVILTTDMEHHSNMVPWQELAKRTGARVEYTDMDDLAKKLKLKPKLIAIAHVSNFLGTINDIRLTVQLATRHVPRAKVLVDGAQAVPQMPVDVQDLGIDFYAFSGHKMYGPMGIGGLWVRKEILERMGPFMTGGGTISEVHTTGTIFTDLPDRFDAGTPNVAGAVGLAAAAKYLERIGMQNVRAHAKELTNHLINQLSNLEFVKIYGPKDIDKRGGLVAFTVEGVHAHDVAQVLDSEGIAVRSGHHCTMPMHEKLGIAATVRASFGIYNTKEEVDKLIEGLGKVKKVFHG
jgi:cysteine desulfurase / selenocysteine lyase